MAQRSFSTSTCQAESSHRRPLTLKLSNCKQKSEDDYHAHSKPYSDESDRLRRVQSFKYNRKSSRRSKVMYRVRGKSMIKVKLSPVTPPEGINADFELHLEGTKGTPCVTPNKYEKSFKFFVDPDNLKNRLSADIIFKKNMKEVERVPVLDLLDIDKAKRIECKTVDLQASPPEWKFSDLRTFDNSEGFLCDQEQRFQERRKLYILTSLQKLLNTELKADDVPHIALMGSGGGYRAMVAMSGIINALYNTKVLDCILYTAVLSGSSWLIATLYSHPEWPNIDPKYIQKQLKTDISKNPKSISQILRYGWNFFYTKWEGKSWNFTTDVFGPMLGGVLIPNRLNCKWSEQQDKLAEGIVPLPLLSAIHAKDEQNTKTFHEWVEFSPYEVSIPKYGAAIDMKNFGSEFDKGLLTQRIDEIPLFKIMGICGSAFTLTHEELANKDSSDFMTKQTSVKSNRQHLSTKNKKEKHLDKKGSVTLDVLDGPPREQDDNDKAIDSSEIDVLESGCASCVDFKESNVSNFTENEDVFHDGKEQRKPQLIRSQPSEEEMEDLFERVCQIRKEGGLIFEEERTRDERVVGDIFKEGMAEADELDGVGDYCKKFFMKSRRHRAAMVNNFMRKVSFDETDSCRLQGDKNPLFENYLKNDIEKLCLIDAGLAFNSPYPLLFKPGRDVDLILSFDFTDRKKDSNDPFKTLLTAEDWARKHEIKFPKINVDKYEGKNVQELYIFEDENDPECPIIMHFVLVNKDFRTYKKPGVKRNETEKEFANFTVYDDQKTFNCTNFQYSAENFDRLSQLSEFIVLNNIVHIKACITKSIQNKQKRKQTGRQRHPSSPV
ncbi:cytosolic phospholipase A2-like [Mytilus californianus]|uniref:cytosolic phospholipase A2-like n=1 Tax=Mytilus californianus TaxID=6549 RepID=UPI002245209D|nr:cytosolic phospholipase A2-like [Mytilus californianus]